MSADPRTIAAAVAGVVIPVVLWVALVPWDLSDPEVGERAVARIGMVILLTAVAAGAGAFMDRAAGRSFVVVALVASLVLFMRAGLTARDPLWPLAAPLFLLVTLGALVLAFALGRRVRSGSTMD